MKQALIVTAFAGFVRSFLVNDIKILQNMGYEVHCAANKNHNGSEGILKFFEENDVRFHQVDFSSNKPISKKTVNSYFNLKKIITNYNFDVVHVHTPITGVLTRLICKKQRKNGTKVIYTTHGFYFHKYSERKSWLIYRTIENWMSKYSDAIITINKEDYGNAKRMHCENVFYIPGVGVDIDRFKSVELDRESYRKSLGIKNTDFLILAIGELSYRKNHRAVIEALAMSKIKNAVFVICGNAMTEGNTKEFLESLAKEKGVDLRLMGLRKDIPEICKCADIGVMPSLREGLGLAGIEMLASGVPVVGFGVHGIVDYIIDGVNGYLVKPYSVDDFCTKIQSAYENLYYLKKNCEDSVEKFDKRFSSQAMSNIYEQILGK